ncbi:MAG: DUF4878 domain-containing protein [Azoarcus sp.]|jgi:hypothetical protein|nr:DUF4878 domain-containing protein [Azoarcus sp.]
MHYFNSVVRKLSVFWMSLFVLVLAACSPSAPEDVVKDFYKAVADNRVDDAVAYFSLQDVKENDLTVVKGKLQMVVGERYSRIQDNGGLESITTEVVEQQDDTARVKVELKFKNGKTKNESARLVKDSGKWKMHLK